MEGHIERRAYPLTASGYELLEEIGQGVSATVYRARCLSFNEIVAVKCLDLEKCVSNLDGIRREAQMMSLINHANVVKAYCSFVSEQTLWVVMPYMAGGSCLHIMKSAHPDGFDEPVIATVLKAALKALEYLHRHGHIHRDVKAGNILVDANGAIKLGDFGVSACMFDTGDRQRSRNTFVGTPCWMAPEVMEQIHGYDFKADIWSFGITGLELAHGHAPFSKYPPMKVLLMTLQNAPPGLDYERDKRFSKLFKEMIAMCLVKDPAKRPSAEKLLKHSFFKQAKTCDYVIRRVLEGLPSLGDRVKTLKMNDAIRLAQKKMASGEWEERSQNEYKRGVSSWDFDVEDLKTQAAMIEDDGSAAAGAKQKNDVSNAQAQRDRKEENGTFNSRVSVGSKGAAASNVVVRDQAEGKHTSNLGQVNEENDVVSKSRHRKEIDVAKGHFDRIGSEEGVTPAAAPTVEASSVKPKATAHSLPVDTPNVDNKLSLPSWAALPPSGKGCNSSSSAAAAAVLSEGGGAGALRAPLRVNRPDSMASLDSRRAEGVIGRSASLGKLNHHHRQVGRFNVCGGSVDLSSANCIVDGNDSGDEQWQIERSRKDDGGHVSGRGAAAGASSFASGALAADRDGGEERGQSHREQGSSEERGWSKPEFWERGTAGVAERSTVGKEAAGAIVQKKGRFSITSEDVDTERAPTEKEREQGLLINELQSRIANLVNELHTMKTNNLELERQLREGEGGRVNNLRSE